MIGQGVSATGCAGSCRGQLSGMIARHYVGLTNQEDKIAAMKQKGDWFLTDENHEEGDGYVYDVDINVNLPSP